MKGARTAEASLLFAVVLTAATAHAGFRLTDENGMQTLVSNGRLKQQLGGAARAQTVIDMRTGDMWMSNAERKIYWQGTVDEFCGQMRQAASAIRDAVRTGMKDRLAAMSPAERAKVEEAMKHFGAFGRRESAHADAHQPHVKIERTDDTSTVAGRPTRKYRLFSDGELRGEYWIGTEGDLARELALDRAATTMGQFRSCQIGPGSSGAPGIGEQGRMFSKGFPLKTRTYVGGKPVGSHAYTRVEEVDVPDGEFSPPAGFRRVTIRETMFAGPDSPTSRGPRD